MKQKEPIENALQIAHENLGEIRTVSEWAWKMGYNCPKYFSRKFRNKFDIRPKLKLTELRVNKFIGLINEYPTMSCYEIALLIGLKDEIALSKYIKRNTGKSPRDWAVSQNI